MKKIVLVVFLCFVSNNFVIGQETQTYKLTSGDVISGKLISENDSTLIIETALGKLSVSKDNLQKQSVQIILNSGDKITGVLLKETKENITVETALGVLELSTDKIKNLTFITESTSSSGGTVFNKSNDKWYFSEERLIDLWFDPTGFSLKSGDFYFSALSWAYGLSDRVQFSTQWFGYFLNDFNIRPKITLFQTGNIESQSSFAIGGHFHTAGQPRKWKEGTRKEEYYDYNTGTNKLRDVKKWTRVGTTQNPDDIYDEIEQEEIWFETFAAYSVSKKRENNQGRITYTIGGTATYYPDEDLMPRFYAGIDIDANRRMKILAEIIYDPYFVPLNYRFDEGINSQSAGPIFFDLGFMTNLVGVPLLGRSDNLWFGIHFLDPYFSIYYKF